MVFCVCVQCALCTAGPVRGMRGCRNAWNALFGMLRMQCSMHPSVIYLRPTGTVVIITTYVCIIHQKYNYCTVQRMILLPYNAYILYYTFDYHSWYIYPLPISPGERTTGRSREPWLTRTARCTYTRRCIYLLLRIIYYYFLVLRELKESIRENWNTF